MEKDNKIYMVRCIELAKVALQNGNPPVGAIVVHNDQIIGEGVESGKSMGDITNHAEIQAIREVVSNGKQHLLDQSKMYTTHEPCIMCSYVIRHHNIPHIVYGVSVDFIGGFTSRFDVLKTEEVPRWGRPPEITVGICEAECQNLSEKYLRKK